MHIRPSVAKALALSAVAAICGCVLGMFLFSIYIAIRWTVFPFNGHSASLGDEAATALLSIAVLGSIFASLFALPLTVLLGLAVIMCLYRIIHRHFTVISTLLIVTSATFGAWFAPWIATSIGDSVSGALVGGSVALCLSILTKLYVKEDPITARNSR